VLDDVGVYSQGDRCPKLSLTQRRVEEVLGYLSVGWNAETLWWFTGDETGARKLLRGGLGAKICQSVKLACLDINGWSQANLSKPHRESKIVIMTPVVWREGEGPRQFRRCYTRLRFDFDTLDVICTDVVLKTFNNILGLSMHWENERRTTKHYTCESDALYEEDR
jgi:hypothetical protein